MLMPSSRFDLPFTCIDSTGLPTAPTGTPTATLVKNGVDQSTSVTVTMSGAQGLASCTIPSDAAAGDRFYLRVSAVIAAVTYVVSGPSDAIESPKTLTTAYDAAKAAAPSSSANAAAVRAELTTELARVDASISSRLAAASYTPCSIPPSAAAIASQVRTELTTELARVDTPISTRLASSSYTSVSPAPTTTEIATQVRTELNAELARIDTSISSRATPGAAMSLTGNERTAIASAIESGLLDDQVGGTFLASIQSLIATALSGLTQGNNGGNSGPSLEAIAASVSTAVRNNLATELARLDAAVSSRLATADYTSPPSLAGLATGDSISNLSAALNSLPNASQIAAAILLDSSRKLLTDEQGHVTVTGGGTTSGGNSATFVMPLRSTSMERVQANRIDLFVRERVPLTISIFDGQRQPIDCTGLDCTLFIEGGIEIPNLSPTTESPGNLANRYSFVPPESMTAAAATRWFSLRVNDSTQRVLAFGHLVIAEVP